MSFESSAACISEYLLVLARAWVTGTEVIYLCVRYCVRFSILPLMDTAESVAISISQATFCCFYGMVDSPDTGILKTEASQLSWMQAPRSKNA